MYLSIKVVESDDIPEHVLELAKAKRQELIENIADLDDEIANAYLDEREITEVELTVCLISCLHF